MATESLSRITNSIEAHTRDRFLDLGVTDPWMLSRASFMPAAIRQLGSKLANPELTPELYLASNQELLTLAKTIELLMSGQVPLKLCFEREAKTLFKGNAPVDGIPKVVMVYQLLHDSPNPQGKTVHCNTQIAVYDTLERGSSSNPQAQNESTGIRFGLRYIDFENQTRWVGSIDSGSFSGRWRVSPPVTRPLSRAISQVVVRSDIGTFDHGRDTTFYYSSPGTTETGSNRQLTVDRLHQFTAHLNGIFKALSVRSNPAS